MLNEKVDFQFMQSFVIVLTILFLAAMWGGCYFFFRFKKRDDAYRNRFQDIHGENKKS